MSDLAALGLDRSTSLLLIAPPDAAMAEAARMRPRPSFASGVMTAEPADDLVWWLTPEEFTNTAVQRLAWMTGVSKGTAWLILEEGEALGAVLPGLQRHGEIDGRPVYVFRASAS